MDSLEKQKAEWESLILEIAKNDLPQIELLLTAQASAMLLPQSASSPGSALI